MPVGQVIPATFTLDWRLVIALLALIISLISLFYKYFQPAAIKLLIGEPFGFFYGKNNFIGIRVPITLFNEGSKNTAAVRIDGRITEVNSRRTMSFVWRSFAEEKNIGIEGEEFRPHHIFAGWAHTIIVPARDAVFKLINFGTFDNYELSPGNYKLEFSVRTGLKAQISASGQRTIEISGQDSIFMDQECRPNDKRIIKNNLSKFSEENKRMAT